MWLNANRMHALLRVSVFAALIAISYCHQPLPANNASRSVDVYTIDLDQPPSERWVALARQFQAQLSEVVKWVKTKIPRLALPVFELIGDYLEKHLPASYAAEIKSIAAATGHTPAELFILNTYYDVMTSCTSIVAAHSNGTVFHGRNLDYGIPGLQNITADILFTKGGKLLYRGTTYVGYVGLLTGLRPGAFSVSIDARHTKNGTVWDNAAEAFLKGGHSIGLFLRDLLETQASFQDALPIVQSVHLDAPSYIIMGGTNGQGAIVTRERSSAVDTWKLDSGLGRWFLVETNDDHWEVPDDIRRDAANGHMNATTPDKVSQQFMSGVMSAYPNLNSETTYTTIMNVDGGVYYSKTHNL